MSDYPSIAQTEGTVAQPRTFAIERYATNGAFRLRYIGSRRKCDITVVHALASGADRRALLDFYDSTRTDAHRIDSFTFTAAEDGARYTCIFAPTPFEIEPVAGMVDTYNITVYLHET
jgi:hypothetical protein